jgi:hypothetical protein
LRRVGEWPGGGQRCLPLACCLCHRLPWTIRSGGQIVDITTSRGKSSPGSALSPYSPLQACQMHGGKKSPFCSSSHTIQPRGSVVTREHSRYSSGVIEHGEKKRARSIRARIQDLSGGKRRQNPAVHSCQGSPAAQENRSCRNLYKEIALVLPMRGGRPGNRLYSPCKVSPDIACIPRQDDPRQNENSKE